MRAVSLVSLGAASLVPLRAASLLVLGVAALGVLATSARADDAPPRAFVETIVPDGPLVPGQRETVGVRFGVDRAFFAAHAVPMFRQPLDVPVSIRAPWLEGGDGQPTVAPPNDEEGQRVALNGRVAKAQWVDTRAVGGRPFDVYRVVRTVRAQRPVEHVLTAPVLQFAHATSFETDLLGGRVARDQQDAQVVGTETRLVIRPLPKEGRPPSFVDAVGQFDVRAQASRIDVDEGAPFVLRLHIRGDGNLDTLTPPRLDALAGFHVYAREDDLQGGERTIRYELAVTDPAVTQVPPIAFAYFDPGPPAGFVVRRTQPQPLRITPRERPATSADDAPPGTTAPWGRVAVLALLLALAGGGALAWRRRRRVLTVPRPAGPDPVRVAAARERLVRARSAGEQDRAQALAELLAAHTNTAPAAMVDPSLPGRLMARGMPEDLARRISLHLEALVAARYGGPRAGPDEGLMDEVRGWACDSGRGTRGRGL